MYPWYCSALGSNPWFFFTSHFYVHVIVLFNLYNHQYMFYIYLVFLLFISKVKMATENGYRVFEMYCAIKITIMKCAG